MSRTVRRSRLFWLPAAIIAFAMQAGAQDFQKTYPITAGGTVKIRNVSGDVIVQGYDGQGISVAVYKTGRDRDMVDVEDLSSGNVVDLRARYPRNCNCDASLKFQVSVPRSMEYVEQITTASGNIQLRNVTGRTSARTASGDVLAEGLTGEVDVATASGEVRVQNITGTVNARSASGDVEAEIAQLEGSGDLKFSTASGDVHVKLPANADATVHMSSRSGSISTDFPIEVQKDEYGQYSRANGRIGNGSRNIHISSASGSINLARQ
jgi:hypothetical protein